LGRGTPLIGGDLSERTILGSRLEILKDWVPR
jgi:hypothetical protein